MSCHHLGAGCTLAECVRALKGLALPRSSHSSEIALAGSRRLLAAASVLFAHTAITTRDSEVMFSPYARVCMHALKGPPRASLSGEVACVPRARGSTSPFRAHCRHSSRKQFTR